MCGEWRRAAVFPSSRVFGPVGQSIKRQSAHLQCRQQRKSSPASSKPSEPLFPVSAAVSHRRRCMLPQQRAHAAGCKQPSTKASATHPACWRCRISSIAYKSGCCSPCRSEDACIVVDCVLPAGVARPDRQGKRRLSHQWQGW